MANPTLNFTNLSSTDLNDAISAARKQYGDKFTITTAKGTYNMEGTGASDEAIAPIVGNVTSTTNVASTTSAKPNPVIDYLKKAGEAVFPTTAAVLEKPGENLVVKGLKAIGAGALDVVTEVPRTVDEFGNFISHGKLNEFRDYLKSKVPGEGYFPEVARNLIGAAATPSTYMGIGGAPKIAEATGELLSPIEAAAGAVTTKGKNILKSGMKVKDPTALLAGKNLNEGVNKIVGDIDKYNVQSTTGGVVGIASNAQKRINKEMAAAQAKVDDFTIKNPTQVTNVDETFMHLMDDFKEGKYLDVFGSEEQAVVIANDIHKALEIRHLTGDQPISKLPEIKQAISHYAGGLFKKGKYGIATDPLKKQVGEITDLQFKKELERFIPGIKDNNSAVHDLINVKKAATDAAKRIGNKNKMSINDWGIVLASLLGGPQLPKEIAPVVAPIIVPAIVARKALSGGRGASGLITAGKGLKEAARTAKRAIATPYGTAVAAPIIVPAAQQVNKKYEPSGLEKAYLESKGIPWEQVTQP